MFFHITETLMESTSKQTPFSYSYHAAVSLIHPGPHPCLSTGIIKALLSFPYKVFHEGKLLSSVSVSHLSIPTSESSNIPFIHKPSPALTLTESLQTPSMQDTLQDGFQKAY